jgi:hypothetical protein
VEPDHKASLAGDASVLAVASLRGSPVLRWRAPDAPA